MILTAFLFASAGIVPLWAQNEIRLALVIGNGAYQNNTTLKNPSNDATDVAAALKNAGFAVTLLVDARRDQMENAVRDFGTALKNPDAVGLFYYSGHGAQVEGQNYLLPVDADIQDADELKYKAMDAEAVLAKMRSAGNKLNMVFLDACRNNPFPGSGRSGERGLSIVKVKVPESIIVYAADPGAIAQDGDGRNSPFTKAFLQCITIPGQDVSLMMKQVTGSVKTLTGGNQTPWISSNLTKDFMFVPGSASSVPVVTPGKTPSFGTVQAATGNLTVKLATAGTLSVGGISAQVPAGTVPVNDLPAGSTTASVRYADGKTESYTVTVPAGGTTKVSFSYVPAIGAPNQDKSITADKPFTNSIGMSFVPVAGGSFGMGSNNVDEVKLIQIVTLTGFSIANTEVTQKQWQAVMGTTVVQQRDKGDKTRLLQGQGDNYPMLYVSWYDAVEFCNKLSAMEGLSPAYTINNDVNDPDNWNVVDNGQWLVTLNQGASGYRLPTEAEWEYAAKGGNISGGYRYAGSDTPDDVAWYNKTTTGSGTRPVGTKKANELGLYDMSGNVWEWCWDWDWDWERRRYDHNLSQIDHRSAPSSRGRVERGGSWCSNVASMRPADRAFNSPSTQSNDLGFRVVRPLAY